MEHEREFIDEDKSQQQTRIHAEALRRLQGDVPAVGGSPTRQSEVIADREVGTQDAQLSWGGGDAFVGPGGPGDVPFTSELARISGLGNFERSTVTPQSQPFEGLQSAPGALESNSGRVMSSKDLFKD